MNKTAHYRIECVNDFKFAKEGSINLEAYTNQFANINKIQQLKEQFQALITSKITPKILEKMSSISRQISHEVERANFPQRYVNYETNIFGSARLAPTSPEFKEVSQIAEALVYESRISINTGGGPGIMEAANEGLKKGIEKRKSNGKDANTQNRGILIPLPFEEAANEHLDIHNNHETFGTRLNEFYDRGNSAISWDGGGGTDLENGYGYQVKQVHHLEQDHPLILKRKAWEKIQEVKMQKMYHDRKTENLVPLISPKDLDVFTFVDHPDDAIHIVLQHYTQWVQQVFQKLDKTSQKLILGQ